MMRTAAVLTVSDSAADGERTDLSGPATAGLLQQYGFEVLRQEIIADDQPAIESALIQMAGQAQLVVTTGGTGIAERDVTPEATRAICSKLIEGIPEKMRAEGVSKTSFAVLSRGVCGVHGRSLILNLPGSPTAASESLLAVIEILPHALDLLAGRTVHERGEPTNI